MEGGHLPDVSPSWIDENFEKQCLEEGEKSEDVTLPFIFLEQKYGSIFFNMLKETGIKRFEFKRITELRKLRFLFKRYPEFFLVTIFLTKIGANYYTHDQLGDRKFRVVIHGLPLHCADCIPIGVLKEVKSLGFTPGQIFHGQKKGNTSLYYLDLLPNENNKEIFKVTKLYNASVKIEHRNPRQIAKLLQCKNCQAFGHSKNYCYFNPKCVQCASPHPSSDCPKNPRRSPICANCRGGHMANYKNCPVRLKFLNNKIINTKKENDTGFERATENEQMSNTFKYQKEINENVLLILNKMVHQLENLILITEKILEILS